MSTTTPSPEPLTAAAYLRLILLGALIGVPAALVAAGFLALVHVLEQWLWDDLPDALGHAVPPWYLVIGLPVAGALVVLVARTFLPGDGGRPPLEGISAKPTPLSHGPGVALAAIGTLAFGAVLGPEAPLIALGSVVGMALTTFVRLGSRETAVMATAGSFSAISALFGGPLVAGLLLLEAGVGLGAALIPALLPGLVAAAVGYVIFVGLGSWGGLDTSTLAVPGLPAYEGTHLLDLLTAVVVGVAAGLLLAAVRFAATRVSGLQHMRFGMPVLLVAGALAVGLLAQLAAQLGADSQAVLFSGQSGVPELVGETSTTIVVILLVAKALGYAVSLGCGFRGGPVFPAIFLGVALAMLAVVWFDTSPTLAVAVGTAAGMAATTRLLFAPLLFAALLAGSQGVDTIPAAVLAATAAWVTATALTRRSSRATENADAATA
ncbi:MAG: chloride channel protein [Jiangellaceae bacterium]